MLFFKIIFVAVDVCVIFPTVHECYCLCWKPTACSLLNLARVLLWR